MPTKTERHVPDLAAWMGNRIEHQKLYLLAGELPSGLVFGLQRGLRLRPSSVRNSNQLIFQFFKKFRTIQFLRQFCQLSI